MRWLDSDEESPFKTIRFPDAGKLRGWIKEFPGKAMEKLGLGDLSIIHDWKWACKQ